MLGRVLSSRWAPGLLALVLLFPSIIWIGLDHGVWSWDPASYAEHALVLNLDLSRQPSVWWAHLLNVSGPHAPGIEWIGQWFASLRGITGSVERSLLLLTLLCQAGILILIWLSIRTLTEGSPLPSLAACLFTAAAPLFVGLSTKFLVEPLQAFAVAGFLWASVASKSWRPLSTVTALLAWGSLALLAKVSSPLYCIVPGSLLLGNVLRPRALPVPRESATRRLARWGAFCAALGIAAATAAWYRANLIPVLEFAKTASSSRVAELYGHRAPFLQKVAGWLFQATVCFSRWQLWLLLLLGAAGSMALTRLRRAPAKVRPDPRLACMAAVSALQIGLVVATLAMNVNEDVRFAYALLPFFATIVAWLVSRLEHGAASATAIALLFFQYSTVHAAALGLAKNGTMPYVEPVQLDRRQQRAVAALVAATSDAETHGHVVFIAAELRWLNHSTYRWEARKQSERTGFMPAPEGFGYQLLGLDEAFRAIQGEHPVAVISYVDPNDSELASRLNQNVRGLAERFRGSAAFLERALPEDPAIRIFRLKLDR